MKNVLRNSDKKKQLERSSAHAERFVVVSIRHRSQKEASKLSKVAFHDR